MKKKKENEVRSVSVEDIGSVYIGMFRGEDIWGNWHEEDYYCHIETKDGKTIDVAELMSQAFDVGFLPCALPERGEECHVEGRDDCLYLDRKGVCKPPLFKFKITIETECLDNRWLVKQTAKESDMEKQQTPLPTPPPISDVFESSREQLRNDLNLSPEVLNRTRELIEEYQSYIDKYAKQLISRRLSPERKISMVSYSILPKHLQPEIIIGACLYLACIERGTRITQFKISKVQGHYDANTISKAVRAIRANLRMDR